MIRPLALAALVSFISATAAPTPRIVYITVTDAKRVPVPDLTAADLTVKEDGKTREIVKVERAVVPMTIAIIVDDNGTGLFRFGVANFAQKLLGRAEFSISTVTGQVMRLVDYTPNAQLLSEAISKLNARASTNDGGQLLAGVSEAARELTKRRSKRPIIIALTVGGEEHTPIPAHQVLNELADSGAQLYVVSVAESVLRSTVQATKPSDLLEENMNRGEVLGDGAKQSGGRHDEIVAAAGIVQGLQTIGDELLGQYAVTYMLPEGVKPADKVSFSLKRKGALLRAPSRIPEK
jgi:VWFA-related protein